MMFKTPFVLFFALVASVCAYSDEIFALMQRDSYLANAPYCLEKFLLTDLFHNGRYYLEKQGLQVVQIFKPDFGRNTQLSAYSFLGINDTAKEIVISFRGSLTLNDWIVDFTFLPKNYKPLSGVGECTGDCKVHLGVYEQFKLTYKDIITTFNGIKATHPDYSVTVTGHSLGAGYAYLMGVELQLLGHQPTLITYGGLRMGNAAMNDWVDSIFKSKEVADRINAGETPLNSYIRVVQAYDIVPLVPPGPLYNHAGVSFTIRDNSTLFPSKADVVFDGYKPKLNEIIADILLSGRILDLLRALDHNKFFRRMAIPCLSDTVSISGR